MTLPGMTKPLKPIPVFKQMPGEKKKSFFRRMDLTAQVQDKCNLNIFFVIYEFNCMKFEMLHLM